MKILFSHLKNYKGAAALAPLCKLVEALLELLIPLFVADIIDRGLGQSDYGAIIFDVCMMIGLGAMGLAFSIVGQYFSAKAATGFSSDVRGELYKKLLFAPSEVTDKIGVSGMITRMTSDINQMQNGLNLALRLFLRSPFIVFGALIAAMTIDLIASLVFAAVIAVLFIIVIIIMKITMPKYGEAQKKLDDVALAARENLTGARVIRAFGAEDDEIESYRQKTSVLAKFQDKAGAISALLNPLTFAAVNLAVIALMYVGAIRVEAGVLTQGAILALYDYLSQILIELVKFANLIVTVSKSLACGKRVADVLSEKDGLKVEDGEKISNHYIEYSGVCASYGLGGDALKDVSFTVERGETVGVIGGTGSGKSTLINLLPRFYDVREGFVAIDGKDVKTYPLSILRKKVAVVLQRAALFKGSIEDNISLGENVSEEDIDFAVKAAQATDVVEVKGGLNAEVEQSGRNFSGGQKQRLSIARALARKPEILILDDSSSALDYATDLSLRRSIANLGYTVTTFIVSQRTASVRNADKIIVLDDGKVVGVGTHDELLKSCPEYLEISLSQEKGGAV
ncbi:MAG: ABC transporter ATP-binding protein [Clostridia bacterium]|nr:ABC transporter ATP-binding protein [Clostridia bacterium]